MNEAEIVQDHYTIEDLPDRFERVLQGAGFGPGPIKWSDLAPIDQFHMRGLAATQELALGLDLAGGETVLDVGCGFGGPARFLAATQGCHVTGIDMTPAYIEVAEMLGKRTGLADRLRFIQGDALDLPFPNESFDHAWTQHVAMNIADKDRLYREIFRVLKPGGRLAIYDVVRGNGELLHFPVPWAPEAKISFLATPDEMTQALRTAGFREVSAVDTTAKGLAWFAEFRAAPPSSGNTAPFNLMAILGPDSKQSTANFGLNLAEGRAQLRQVIAQKD